MLISVENRSRPNSTSKAGVTVPWIIACTAIGIAGVALAWAVVGITTGEGVTGVLLGLITAAITVSVGGSCGMGEAVAGAVLVGVVDAAAGTLFCRVDRARRSSPSARLPESSASRTEPRACTM